MSSLALTGIDAPLAADVLTYLGVTNQQAAVVDLLDALVKAYTRRVPWDSASRIVRRAQVLAETGASAGEVCARWPDQFWQEAIAWGTGGTCFESNYAFLAILEHLGYSGYLTVNNMEPTIGCHSAIVLRIDGRLWLADVGLPLYAPIPLDPNRLTQRDSPFHRYTARPIGPNAYRIERSHHPQSYCFTLIDEPVPEEKYRQVLADDYGPAGLFLDRVIISKVVGDHICRFDGGQSPYRLEKFRRGSVVRRELSSGPARELAQFFDYDEAIIDLALEKMGEPAPRSGPGSDGP